MDSKFNSTFQATGWPLWEGTALCTARSPPPQQNVLSNAFKTALGTVSCLHHSRSHEALYLKKIANFLDYPESRDGIKAAELQTSPPFRGDGWSRAAFRCGSRLTDTDNASLSSRSLWILPSLKNCNVPHPAAAHLDATWQEINPVKGLEHVLPNKPHGSSKCFTELR